MPTRRAVPSMDLQKFKPPIRVCEAGLSSPVTILYIGPTPFTVRERCWCPGSWSGVGGSYTRVTRQFCRYDLLWRKGHVLVHEAGVNRRAKSHDVRRTPVPLKRGVPKAA